MTAPPPLTPKSADLRDFPRMMIDITRLRQSSFDATIDDAAWRAGLNLWFSAWHSVPAGSLAADDASLAKAAGLGRDVRTWRDVKGEAMRGFIECSDGRFYHETVCEIVLESWIEKLLQRISSGLGNAKRWSIEFDPAPIEEDIAEAGRLLSILAPGSKSLVKIRRKRPYQNPTGTEAKSHPDQETLPLGSEKRPGGHPDDTENDRKRQGQGQGQGQGYIIDDGGQAEAENTVWDAIKLSSELCRVAGVRNADPGPIGQNVKTVREWITAGADPPMIVTVIQTERGKASNGISRLSYFDRPMHAAIAKRDHPNGKSTANDFSTIRDPLLRRYLERGGTLGV